ncbi:hypothetical protein BMS3Bbin06_00593 [bacterium BMS3Bbin06]|nr:hypothetical protein BMS3Abin08_00827 [bacterium BMS3Abin08]GBE34077.1 hypothetical protein BMS3Bbin06_00593 [bacterium BMS3Bbin06]HDO35092.1 hypothetical protein [Nitrospirota bacterium]HDY71829.1 hypothetical protein [Nitrospirota bacterium]
MGDVKTGDFVAAIYSISKELEECQSQIYNAFIYNKPSFLDEADTVTKRVIDNEERLTTELLAACGKDEKARRYCTVPTNLGRIAFNFGIISRAVRTKIKEDLLFSDKAISEVNFLFNRTKEILNTLSDFLLARNTYTANYLIESEKEIERAATEFATLHEERLIEGLCLPKVSGIYILILDSIKRIAWNARTIAENLVR